MIPGTSPQALADLAQYGYHPTTEAEAIAALQRAFGLGRELAYAVLYDHDPEPVRSDTQ